MVDRVGRLDQIEFAIANQELAFRMQADVPELMDLKGETEQTKRITASTQNSATPAHSAATASLPAGWWSAACGSFNSPALAAMAIAGSTRRPQGRSRKKCRPSTNPSALLADLETRGLLDSTLIIWMGEFGCTPFAQGNNGRDHNPFGFSLWMAGAGVKGGTVYGGTDEYVQGSRKRLEIHDLHATMLLGMDHTKLTIRFTAATCGSPTSMAKLSKISWLATSPRQPC